MSAETRLVTVERVSKAGNPLSKEAVRGVKLIVYGGEPGERYRVRVLRHCGALVGGIVDPSPAEHERAVEQRQRRERRYERRKRSSSSKPSKKPRSAKQMKRQIGEKRAAHRGPVGSPSFDDVPGLYPDPQPPAAKPRRKTTASESLQDLGRRLGGTSVSMREEHDDGEHVAWGETPETVKELRRRAGRHQ